MTDVADAEARGWATAQTLAEALPYISTYDRETVVIKYGGHAMGEEAVARTFAADAVLLKLLGVHPVVVHGGGPQISRMLKKAGVNSTFIDGLRVTDEATMEVAEMVLCGAINKEIVHYINMAGAEADVRGVGLSGKDARLITVEKVTRTRIDPDSMIEQAVDLGFVGEPTKVDPQLVQGLISSANDYVPVIAPIGVSATGQTYNINADTCAGAVAAALKAKRMLLLTDVAGVLDGEGRLMRELSVDQARGLIASGVASGGMIPKLETAISRGGGRGRGRGDPGRTPPPRHAGRALQRAWLGDADMPVSLDRDFARADLRHVDTWLFDLDNTLYPAGTEFVGLIEGRMTAYVMRLTGLDHPGAYALQKRYLHEHGTTLSGLMANHGIEPHGFLEEVHDVAIDSLTPDFALNRALEALPGRRLIFTNASAAHAERVLGHLGMADLFADVFHLEASDLLPKPDPRAFARMMAAHAVKPATTAFFEDSVKNLAPASDLGMTTVLVGRHASADASAFVDHRTDDLTTFLGRARTSHAETAA